MVEDTQIPSNSEEEQEENEDIQVKSISQQLAEKRKTIGPSGFVSNDDGNKEQKHPIRGMFDELIGDETDEELLSEKSVLQLVMLSRLKPMQIQAVSQMLMIDKMALSDIHKRMVRFVLVSQIGEQGKGRVEYKEGLRDIRLPSDDENNMEGESRL